MPCINSRLFAASIASAALVALPACENSNSPDHVTAPTVTDDHADHEGHDHGSADHAGHELPEQEITPPSAPTPGATKASDAERLTVGGFSFAIPENWEKRPPSNSMRLVELAAPAAGGAPAPVAAFSLAGGDIDANITRWQGQFTEPDSTRSRETTQIAGTTVHLVEMAGTFRGMGGPAQTDTVMRAAIVERPGQPSLFIKMTGRSGAMDPAGAGWDALINSMTTP